MGEQDRVRQPMRLPTRDCTSSGQSKRALPVLDHRTCPGIHGHTHSTPHPPLCTGQTAQQMIPRGHALRWTGRDSSAERAGDSKLRRTQRLRRPKRHTRCCTRALGVGIPIALLSLQGTGGEGATATGPDATHPPISVKPWRGAGSWHKASVSGCLPLAAPIGLSPLLIRTLCGPERVLVVSTEPPDDLSCWTTPGVGRPADGLLPVPGGGGEVGMSPVLEGWQRD